jgi:hypothetical protein
LVASSFFDTRVSNSSTSRHTALLLDVGTNLEGLLASELVCKWIEQKKFDPFGVSRESVQGLIVPKELVPSWGKEPVATAAAWWEWHVRQARESGQLLGPRLYYEVHYETLVERPDEECDRLCAFLGIPYDSSMLRFH